MEFVLLLLLGYVFVRLGGLAFLGSLLITLLALAYALGQSLNWGAVTLGVIAVVMLCRWIPRQLQRQDEAARARYFAERSERP